MRLDNLMQRRNVMENLDDAEKNEGTDFKESADFTNASESDDDFKKEKTQSNGKSDSLDFLDIEPLQFRKTPQRNKELHRFCDIINAPFINVPLLVVERQEDILPLLSLYTSKEKHKGKKVSFYSIPSANLKDDDGDDHYDLKKMDMAANIVESQKEFSDFPVYCDISDYKDHGMLDKFTYNFLRMGMPAILCVSKQELEGIHEIIEKDRQISGGIKNPLTPYEIYGFARTKEIEIAPLTREEKQIYFSHHIERMFAETGVKCSPPVYHYFINQVLNRFSHQDVFFKVFDLMNHVVSKTHKAKHIFISKKIINQVIQEYAPLHNRTLALMDLDERLKKKIYGQDQAIEECYETILSDIDDDNRTKPVVLGFFGPSGVGKTALAEEISLALTGKKVSTINMGEYSDGFKTSILTGSSKGYVNSDEDGLLAKIVKENPQAVILLDEFEKSDIEVQQVFLGIFDKGSLYDNHSGQIDMSKTTIILTSNAGIRSNSILGFDCSETQEYVADKKLIQKEFPPELLGRLDAKILFKPLSKETLGKIVDKFMNQFKPRFDRLGVRVSLSPEAKQELVEKVEDPSAGARPLFSLIRQKIKTPIEIAVLKKRIKAGSQIIVQSIDKKEMKIVSKHHSSSRKNMQCQNTKS